MSQFFFEFGLKFKQASLSLASLYFEPWNINLSLLWFQSQIFVPYGKSPNLKKGFFKDISPLIHGKFFISPPNPSICDLIS